MLKLGVLLVLAATQALGDYNGPTLSIRHGRSRSHLTRLNQPIGRLQVLEEIQPETDPSDPENPEVENLFSGNLQIAPTVPPDMAYTEEGLFIGPQEDPKYHPKDDAEDFEPSEPPDPMGASVDIVTRFLRIVESQQQLGENCTAGTGLNLGEGVVDRYAQVSSNTFVLRTSYGCSVNCIINYYKILFYQILSARYDKFGYRPNALLLKGGSLMIYTFHIQFCLSVGHLVNITKNKHTSK